MSKEPRSPDFIRWNTDAKVAFITRTAKFLHQPHYRENPDERKSQRCFHPKTLLLHVLGCHQFKTGPAGLHDQSPPEKAGVQFIAISRIWRFRCCWASPISRMGQSSFSVALFYHPFEQFPVPLAKMGERATMIDTVLERLLNELMTRTVFLNEFRP